MSTAGTLIIVVFIMLFVAGMNMKFVLSMLAAGVGLFAVLVIAEPYRLKRFTAFLDPFQDPLGSGYQVIQSLYAIGSGGLFGLGLGKSRQKYFYIPEPQNDFIFAVAGEELGFVGSAVIIILLLFITIECIFIARKAKDTAGRLICCGVGALIGFQTFVNIGVASGLLPNTGVTLPFVSYGQI